MRNILKCFLFRRRKLKINKYYVITTLIDCSTVCIVYDDNYMPVVCINVSSPCEPFIYVSTAIVNKIRYTKCTVNRYIFGLCFRYVHKIYLERCNILCTNTFLRIKPTLGCLIQHL